MHGIKKIKIRPLFLIFALLSIVGVGSFAFLLTQYTLAQFTPPCDTPPNCQPPSGAVTATLMDVLVNGPLAAQEFGKVKDPEGKGYIGIGGGKVFDTGGTVDAGEVRLGIGTSTPGFSLDVITQKSGNTPNDDMAALRLGYNKDDRVWTGLRLDRGAANGVQSEKWFIGMDASADDKLVIRSDSNTNLVEIPPGKGAACFGGILVGLSGDSYVADNDGYKAANLKCSTTFPGSHVCSTEEMFRTQVCRPEKFSESAIDGKSVWFSNGPSSDPNTAANDCGAWTLQDIDSYGGFWEITPTGGTPFLSTCNYTRGKFACCK